MFDETMRGLASYLDFVVQSEFSACKLVKLSIDDVEQKWVFYCQGNLKNIVIDPYYTLLPCLRAML